jgi:predicted transcriptional regulator with HTH domain
MLRILKDRIASPSDIIALTGLPRYEVLASFHILEALNIVDIVYVRGNYKLYKLSEFGKKLLEALENGKAFDIIIKSQEEAKAQTSSIAMQSNSTNLAEATA